MLDGKEINDTAKRFLINWKATKDARRKQKRQFQLEHASSNTISTVPTLPALQGSSHSSLPITGYKIDSTNPMVRLSSGVDPPHPSYFARNHKTVTALIQSRAPHSTLLRQRVHHSEVAAPQSRLVKIGILLPPTPLLGFIFALFNGGMASCFFSSVKIGCGYQLSWMP